MTGVRIRKENLETETEGRRYEDKERRWSSISQGERLETDFSLTALRKNQNCYTLLSGY